MRALALACLIGCSTIEEAGTATLDVTATVLTSLDDCAELVSQAEFEECGREIVRDLDLERTCYCPDGSEWTICGTNSDAQAEVTARAKGRSDYICHCVAADFC